MVLEYPLRVVWRNAVAETQSTSSMTPGLAVVVAELLAQTVDARSTVCSQWSPDPDLIERRLSPQGHEPSRSSGLRTSSSSIRRTRTEGNSLLSVTLQAPAASRPGPHTGIRDQLPFSLYVIYIPKSLNMSDQENVVIVHLLLLPLSAS
jgi:hypothetical protein